MEHRNVDRRSFLNQLGVTVGAAAAATAIPAMNLHRRKPRRRPRARFPTRPSRPVT